MVCSCSLADRLEVGQRHLHRGEPPLLRHHADERRTGRAPAAQRVAGQLAQRAADPADQPHPTATATPSAPGQRPAQVLHGAAGSWALSQSAPTSSSTEVGSGSGCQLSVRTSAGDAVRLGDGVQQHLADIDRVDAVDQSEVGLGHQGEPVVLQTLDQVHLPERPRPVQPAGQDPADELPQLFRRTRPRQRRAAHVEGEVEVLVVHPDRAGQPGRHAADPLPVARHEGDPVPDQPDQPLVVEGLAAGVEDVDGADVARRVRGVQGQQRHLQGGQALRHALSLPAPRIKSRAPNTLLPRRGFGRARRVGGRTTPRTNQEGNTNDRRQCRSGPGWWRPCSARPAAARPLPAAPARRRSGDAVGLGLEQQRQLPARQRRSRPRAPRHPRRRARPNSEPGALTIDITIADGKVDPNGEKIEVEVGQKVS